MSTVLQREVPQSAEPPAVSRPTTEDCAQQAFRTLLSWIGENPNRDGLIETPQRMIKAYAEYFGGYGLDPRDILNKTFDEVDGYDEMIVLRNVRFVSHCEHHMAPIVGRAWVAYRPNSRVVGISKLARVVDCFARRLQIQERMTAQIATAIDDVLKPKGVGVAIKAHHHCMGARGVMKPESDLVTTHLSGCFRDDEIRKEFLSLVER